MPPQPRERRDLIHLLNQRYRREWERAENLQAELTRWQSGWLWPILNWVRRVKRRLRPTTLATEPTPPAPELLQEAAAPMTRRVSIIIPFKDQVELLRTCLGSLQTSTYRRYEIVLVDNGSTESRTHRYLQYLCKRRRVRLLSCPDPFNFSHLCNAGAAQARGDMLLFLNNDVAVETPDWLERLLAVAEQPRVGIVGATLFYPDGTLQHAGICPRADGVWLHPYRGHSASDAGAHGELQQIRTVPAVTGACLLIHRELFNELGGFDLAYPLTYGDVDLCCRARAHGYRVAITPHARLFHWESLSRGYVVDTVERNLPVASLSAGL